MPASSLAVTPDNLLRKLARRETVPAVVLLGSDSYLRDLCRNKLIETYVEEGARDWAVTRLSAQESEWPEIFQRAETVPMLSSRQVVLVSECEALEKLGEQGADELGEALSAYLAKPAPFTVLVLCASQLDARRRLHKILSEKAMVVRLTVDAQEAAGLAAQMGADLGTRIDGAAASRLVEMLDAAPARIHMEIEKLAAYAAGRAITAADVERLVASGRKYSAWQLSEMLASRKPDAALEFLDSCLREGEDPAQIVGALGWVYRSWIKAREMPPNASKWEVARALGANPTVAEAAMRDSRRFPRAELLCGLVALAEADSDTKSGHPDPQALMEFLVMRLSAISSAPVEKQSRN